MFRCSAGQEMAYLRKDRSVYKTTFHELSIMNFDKHQTVQLKWIDHFKTAKVPTRHFKTVYVHPVEISTYALVRCQALLVCETNEMNNRATCLDLCNCFNCSGLQYAVLKSVQCFLECFLKSTIKGVGF